MSENVRIGKQIVDLSKEGNESENMDSELTAVIGNAPVQSIAAPPSGNVMQLPQSELGKWMTRLTKLGQYTLASTDVAEAIIATIEPTILFFNNASVIEKVNNFNLVRGTFEVEMVFTVPPGAYGSYVVVAAPLGDRLDSFDSNFTMARFATIFQMPHGMVDLSQSNNVKLTLPWIHSMDYCTVAEMLAGTGAAYQWTIRIFCLTPITMGNGALVPTAQIAAYGRFLDDVELIIPRRQGYDELRDGVNTALGQKPSSIASTIAGVAGGLAAVPVIGPIAGVVSAGASAIGSVLDWFGFTRTSSQQTPTIVVSRNFSNLANVDVEDTSETASFFKNNSISIDPRIVSAVPEDEASFASIFSKWTYVGRSQLTQSQAVGDQVAVFPVTPFLTYKSMESSAGASMTAAGYVGFPFQYWRGSMEFKLIIPVSQFHRGTIQVAWYPDASVSAEDVTNITFNHVIDLSATREFTFTVGFVDEYPALMSMPKLYDAVIVSSAHANGLIRISVVNPLICNVSTANTSIHVLARAGQDMQFGVPRQVYQPVLDDGTYGSLRDFKTGFYIQAGGTLGDDSTIDKTQVALVPSTPAYPLRDVCFGEDIRSVRTLMQKFSHEKYISRMITETAPGDEFYMSHIRMNNSSQYTQYRTVADSGPDFIWSGYYAAIFVGVAASVRYKIINTSDDSMGIGVVAQDELGGSSNASAGTLNHMNLTLSGQGFEVSVPYYYRKKYISTLFRYSAANVYAGTKLGRNDILSVLTPRTELITSTLKSVAAYSAFGPDIRLGMFACTRSIVAVTPTVTPVYGGNLSVIPPS